MIVNDPLLQVYSLTSLQEITLSAMDNMAQTFESIVNEERGHSVEQELIAAAGREIRRINTFDIPLFISSFIHSFISLFRYNSQS